MGEMFRRIVAVIVLTLTASACGGSSVQSPSPSASPTATPPATARTTATAATSTAEPLTGQIAYIGTDGGLWIMDAEGHDAHEIYTAENGRISLPEWSRAGDRITFTQTAFVLNPEPTTSPYPDFTSVVVVDLTGREVARIPRVIMAHWSPDGTRIATLQEFGLFGESSYGGVPAVINLSDQSIEPLTTHINTLDAPRWSPDGTWLAYTTVTDGVFVLPGDGTGEPRRVLEGSRGLYHGPFTWSDERTVVALEQHDGDFSPSYVFVDVEGAEQVRVPNQKSTACGRDYAPGDRQPIAFGNGQHLAWPMQCQAPSGFWLADVAHPDSPRFFQVRDNGNIVVLSASPDGHHVLYSGGGIGQPLHRQSSTPAPARTPTGPLIWMVDLDAGQGTSVLLEPNGTQAVWSP